MPAITFRTPQSQQQLPPILHTMDFASLKEAAANISLYDIKAGVRKVQNGGYADNTNSGTVS